MMVLESCLATQSWVNREYRRGLSTNPCGAPVLRVRMAEVMYSYTHHLVLARQEVQDPVEEGGVQTQSPKLGEVLGRDNCVEC
jgi:hypothetical protein